MTLPANIRVNTPVPFPALVTGSGPVTVAKVNGVWTLGFSVSSFGIQNPPPLANWATDYALVYDSAAKQFLQVPIQTFAGRVLLNTLTASNSATLTDTTSLTGAFDLYEIELENIVSANDNVTFAMRVSQNGGTSYLAATYKSSIVSFSSGALATDTVTDRILLSGGAGSVDGISSNGSYGLNSLFRIRTPTSASMRKLVEGTCGYYSTASSRIHASDQFAGFYDGNNNAVNALQFLCGSGNITSGKIRIYGVRTS